jgi:tetratricopeptide (TPR) repeat protein
MAAVMLAWEHALQGRRQDVADEAGELLGPWMDDRGAYGQGAALGERHVAVFPDSVAGLRWAGYARYLAGDPRAGRRMVERALELADPAAHSSSRRCSAMDSLAQILASMGEHAAASQRFAGLIAAEETLHPEGSARLGSYLGSHAGVLHAQGDLAGARTLLERSLAIEQKVHGREDHPNVATTYDMLGNCLRDLDLVDDGERAFRTALRIRERVFGNRDHYMYAETEFTLAMLLFQRGQPDEAGELARHAVTVLQAQVPGHWILVMLWSGACRAAWASE